MINLTKKETKDLANRLCDAVEDCLPDEKYAKDRVRIVNAIIEDVFMHKKYFFTTMIRRKSDEGMGDNKENCYYKVGDT